MMRWVGVISVLAAVLGPPAMLAPADAQANELACAMPPALLTPAQPLPHTKAALAKKHLAVLALGSGSTVGETGAGGGAAMTYRTPDASFPYRMEAALRILRPDARITLTVEGGRDITARQMLPMLRDALAGRHIDLVLWQTGTVEAMRGTPPGLLRADLRKGADAARAADADLVLIDPQFSRVLRANTDLGAYISALRGAAEKQFLPLFPRYHLTEAWAESGEVDLERAGRTERQHTIAMLNDCLGEALARFILSGTAER